MANIKKSFNFRNGIQVDDDNFIINQNGLVGIGTSIPTEVLDVRGTAKIVGLVTASQIYTTSLVSISATTTNLTVGNSIVGGGVSIKSGIVTASGSGIVTYYGDGGNLTNLTTSQWLDINVGLGFTSIYARGFVGIGTNDPRFLLQLGGNNNTTLNGFANGVGINSSGSILATGIITASSFVGSGAGLTSINADNISSGTIGTDRIPKLKTNQMPDNINVSGIITATTTLVSGGASITGNVYITGIATITGNVNATGGVAGNLTGNVNSLGVSTFSGGIIGNIVGIASTARDLTSNARINIQDIQASTSTIGISTVSTRLRVSGTIGVSTDSPQANIHIVNASDASLHLTGNQSTITLGRSSSPTGGNSSGLKFGNTSGLYSYSTQKTLDIFNYDTGNLNSYLHYGSTAGVGTGSFNWIYGQSPSTPLMSLTYQGNLGIGITNPTKKLQVDGSIQSNSLNVTGDFTAIGAATSTSVRKLYVYDGVTALLDSAGNRLIPEQSENVNITSGISTFFKTKVTNVAIFDDKIGIGNTNPLESLHIGTQENSLVIRSDGIGIGTDSIRFGLGIDAENESAIFASVGIGTTNPTSALTVVGDTYITGIVTATNGFTSGIGTAVKITTVGNILTFTVPGVGSTSLTLY